mmetsp:Transcript_6611/g.26975  ORF Transcript_6611/g.26975 Transcript_6611/m.26975 type:complete len:266 (-) Transcript_6611:1151-1948(-)
MPPENRHDPYRARVGDDHVNADMARRRANNPNEYFVAVDAPGFAMYLVNSEPSKELEERREVIAALVNSLARLFVAQRNAKMARDGGGSPLTVQDALKKAVERWNSYGLPSLSTVGQVLKYANTVKFLPITGTIPFVDTLELCVTELRKLLKNAGDADAVLEDEDDVFKALLQATLNRIKAVRSNKEMEKWAFWSLQCAMKKAIKLVTAAAEWAEARPRRFGIFKAPKLRAVRAAQARLGARPLDENLPVAAHSTPNEQTEIDAE